MNIYEDDERSILIIAGNELSGSLVSRLCSECGQRLIMHKTFDAVFCPECNCWTEEKCSNPDCEYCKNRPDKPL